MNELRWVSSPNGSVALDDRTYPVLFTTFVGASDHTTLRAFFDWNDAFLARAEREKKMFTMITDASVASAPDANARVLIAELTKKMQRDHPAADALRIPGPVVIDNPLIRGALTAVGWIMGTSLETEYADSCEAAITIVKQRFEARGAAWPVGLTPKGYVPARR
jgi:hypothetical protein